jgi:hypothetical protein
MANEIVTNEKVELRLKQIAIQCKLAETFEAILKAHGDTPQTRLFIAEYTMGYTGASYGLHIAERYHA